MYSKIKLKSKIENDEYTQYIYDAFDVQDTEFSEVEIPFNFDIDLKNDEWNIGVIYGGSGSGKTTILKQFGDIVEPTFPHGKALISCFDFLPPEDATRLLANVGLASVPSWLRPFNVLSNGEQYRAKIAYSIGSAKDGDIVLIDEYTSVVDRDVAKSMSYALAKYIRKNNKKVILASCHFDIMEWLTPNWVYSPYKGIVEKRRYLRQRPEIRLEIFRCRYKTWDLFKQHHYLTFDLNKAAKSFCINWNDKPVGFYAILPFPNGAFKNAFRGSRLVILPDYQGLGIGTIIVDYFAKLYTATGKTFYVRTPHPALVLGMRRSEEWQECGNSGTDRRDQTMFTAGPKSYRVAYSFKYIGEPSKDDTTIVTFNAEHWKGISQNQQNLF